MSASDVEGQSKAIDGFSTVPMKVFNGFVHGDRRSHVILSPGVIGATASHLRVLDHYDQHRVCRAWKFASNVVRAVRWCQQQQEHRSARISWALCFGRRLLQCQGSLPPGVSCPRRVRCIPSSPCRPGATLHFFASNSCGP